MQKFASFPLYLGSEMLGGFANVFRIKVSQSSTFPRFIPFCLSLEGRGIGWTFISFHFKKKTMNEDKDALQCWLQCSKKFLNILCLSMCSCHVIIINELLCKHSTYVTCVIRRCWDLLSCCCWPCSRLPPTFSSSPPSTQGSLKGRAFPLFRIHPFFYKFFSFFK